MQKAWNRIVSNKVADGLLTLMTSPRRISLSSDRPLANRPAFAQAEVMPRNATLGTLTRLLDQSNRPIYVVDTERRIVYCNPALAAWLDFEPARIVGRVVEYHSEIAGDTGAERDSNVPLAELCPPPRALAGEPSLGTISCISRDGSLHHRQAEFVPLDAPSDDAATGNRSRRSPTGAVLVLLAAMDMTPAELSSTLSGDPTADELHRTIRQFRRTQAAAYAVESLLGRSAAMGKVRAQVAAGRVQRCQLFDLRSAW